MPPPGATGVRRFNYHIARGESSSFTTKPPARDRVVYEPRRTWSRLTVPGWRAGCSFIT